MKHIKKLNEINDNEDKIYFIDMTEVKTYAIRAKSSSEATQIFSNAMSDNAMNDTPINVVDSVTEWGETTLGKPDVVEHLDEYEIVNGNDKDE